MIEHGANVLDAAADGQTPLTMAVKSGSFQVVMMVIDRLKALAAPPPGEALPSGCKTPLARAIPTRKTACSRR